MNNSSPQINMVACDTGPKLTFFLKTCAGDPLVDGVSGVDFFLKKYCGSCANEGYTSVSGINPAEGEWRYIFHEGISGAGTYFGDVRVTYDDGTTETAFEAVRILVRSSNRCDC